MTELHINLARTRLPPQPTPQVKPLSQTKKMALVGLFSLLIAEMGQLYNRRPRKAFWMVQVSQPREMVNQDEPKPIYAEKPNDAWNRIFHSLFSRRVQGRFESGDRAIDPLYPIDPSYPSPYVGARQVLEGPLYTELTEGLREAQNDNNERSGLARALMQSDLWSAFDILYAHPLERLEEPRQILLDMLAHLIKKIALTPTDVDGLPDNYTLAAGRSGLPDLFTSGGGWTEVQWFPDRAHDAAAGFRRVTRIFLKPARQAEDAQKFLNSLRDADGQDLVRALDGVAIVIQLILIDPQGKLLPSRITTDVQLRLFAKRPDGHFKVTEMCEYELSRAILLSQAGSGGFVLETDSAPAYLPAPGNDYGFASRQFLRVGAGPPVLVNLRTRCESCHGIDLTNIFTFGMHDPTAPIPPVRQLNPALHEAADYVISRKIAEEGWKALRQYFNSPRHTIGRRPSKEMRASRVGEKPAI